MLSKEFYLAIYDHVYVTDYNASFNEVDLNMAITENELQNNEVKIMKINDAFRKEILPLLLCYTR